VLDEERVGVYFYFMTVMTVEME